MENLISEEQSRKAHNLYYVKSQTEGKDVYFCPLSHSNVGSPSSQKQSCLCFREPVSTYA